MTELSEQSDYVVKQTRSVVFLVCLALTLVIAAVISLWAGSYQTPLLEIIRGIVGHAHDDNINLIVRQSRLPRICTAIVSGAGLGVTGCVLQAILRNPLASASTLGVSQGATFGAAFAIIALNVAQLGVAGSFAIQMSALLGSVAVAVIILGLSQLRQVSPEGIILAGVAISAMLTGGTTLLQYFASDVQLGTLVFWTFGSLGDTTWSDVGFMTVVVAVTSTYFVIRRWDYNAILSGEHSATTLGINVQRFTLSSMLICCLVASVIISNIGLVNFIGLVAPHIVRMVVGSNYKYLIPGSIMAGGCLLLLGDLFSRMVISPVILPIGAVTSFLGGPMFLYLLFKRSKR